MFIENFPLPVGKKVILRAIPTWKKLGTEGWMGEEEKRYFVLIVGLSYSGERKGAGIVNNPWMWIDGTKELGPYLPLIGLFFHQCHLWRIMLTERVET